MKKLLLPLLFLLLPALSYSQKGFADGYMLKDDSLHSVVLNQTRKLNIFLPEGYNTSSTRYPVIYVLDADGRDQHTVPTARFLFLNNKMPKSVIVGVFNIDRNHDFLPDSSQAAVTGGGADNFLQFFKKELIPYIDRNFKTDPYRVIVGHSFGGLFAMNSLLKDPDVFDAYVAIDPSFWYKNQMMVKNASNELLKSMNWKKMLFISGREGGGMKDMGISAMDSILKSSAPKALDWKVVSYSNEDHGSVPFKSVYDGLRFIFDAGGSFEVYPQAGIIPKGTTTYAIILNKSPNLRYTLDGSEPEINSPVCTDTIKIVNACTLKVRNVTNKYNKIPTVTRLFSEGEFLNGQKDIKNLKPGLKFTYFEGSWDSVPDFTKMVPKKSGITDNLDLKIALRNENFAVRYEGYIHITQKALYNIWITSDDGSRVYFNGKLLINNDGLHAADKPAANMLPLSPGYYPIRIDFFQKGGDRSVTLGYLIGNKAPTTFLKEVFYYKQ